MLLTHAWGVVGVAHNGTAPRGVSHRLGWVCERWGRDGGHLWEETEEKTSQPDTVTQIQVTVEK